MLCAGNVAGQYRANYPSIEFSTGMGLITSMTGSAILVLSSTLVTMDFLVQSGMTLSFLVSPSVIQGMMLHMSMPLLLEFSATHWTPFLSQWAIPTECTRCGSGVVDAKRRTMNITSWYLGCILSATKRSNLRSLLSSWT